MLRRTGFKRPTGPARSSFEISKNRKFVAARAPGESEAACGSATDEGSIEHQQVAALKPLRRGTYAHADMGIPISVPKAAPVRSEPYRRLVAAFPCMHCGIAGLSQCAHGNTGKGMGLKTDDRNSFPLCCDTPGRPGCHSRFDRHELFSRAARTAIEQAWAADTRRRIHAAGTWPANLPLWDESLNASPVGEHP